MPASTEIVPLSFRRPSPSQAAADGIPILIGGTYHLFHLTTPPNTIHHPPRLRSTWSHLHSKDLVKWHRVPPPILEAGADKNDHDADGVWTGSAIIGPDEMMHIFYTGYNLSRAGKQVIMHAASTDSNYVDFQKYPEPIAISAKTRNNLATFEDIDFRDPYVLFNELEDRYWMLVSTRLSAGPHWTRGCLALLTTKDLQYWDLEPEPLYAPNDMFCPECPELFTLPNGKWYLAYSRFSSPNAGTVYRIAESPRGPFYPPQDGSDGRWDGRRWYAAKSCPKSDDATKRIYFGWIGDRCAEDRKWMWGGDMAFARQALANPDGSLRIEPIDEILNAAICPKPLIQVPSLNLQTSGKTKTHFPDCPATVHGPYFASFKISPQPGSVSFGLLIRTDDDLAGHWLRISSHLEISGQRFYTAALTCSPPPLDDFWADQYKLHLPREVDGPEIVRHENVVIGKDEFIQILAIGKTLEIFIGGRAMSYRFPPGEQSQNGLIRELGFFIQQGQVNIEDLRVHEIPLNVNGTSGN